MTDYAPASHTTPEDFKSPRDFIDFHKTFYASNRGWRETESPKKSALSYFHKNWSIFNQEEINEFHEILLTLTKTKFSYYPLYIKPLVETAISQNQVLPLNVKFEHFNWHEEKPLLENYLGVIASSKNKRAMEHYLSYFFKRNQLAIEAIKKLPVNENTDLFFKTLLFKQVEQGKWHDISASTLFTAEYKFNFFSEECKKIELNKEKKVSNIFINALLTFYEGLKEDELREKTCDLIYSTIKKENFLAAVEAQDVYGLTYLVRLPQLLTLLIQNNMDFFEDLKNNKITIEIALENNEDGDFDAETYICNGIQFLFSYLNQNLANYWAPDFISTDLKYFYQTFEAEILEAIIVQRFFHGRETSIFDLQLKQKSLNFLHYINIDNLSDNDKNMCAAAALYNYFTPLSSSSKLRDYSIPMADLLSSIDEQVFDRLMGNVKNNIHPAHQDPEKMSFLNVIFEKRKLSSSIESVYPTTPYLKSNFKI